MPRYLVSWTIDSDAATPALAAREALGAQLRFDSIARVFDVVDAAGQSIRVDLGTAPRGMLEEEVAAARNAGWAEGYACGTATLAKTRARLIAAEQDDAPAVSRIIAAWKALTDRERAAITGRMPQLARAITRAVEPLDEQALADAHTTTEDEADHQGQGFDFVIHVDNVTSADKARDTLTSALLDVEWEANYPGVEVSYPARMLRTLAELAEVQPGQTYTDADGCHLHITNDREFRIDSLVLSAEELAGAYTDGQSRFLPLIEA